MAYTQEQVTALRDTKVRETLHALAPIWLVSDQFKPREDSLIFNLVYQDASYGWMSRRFKYDAFNDVLYNMGWKRLTEAETADIQNQEPYISGDVAQHVPNSPGYRTGAESASSFVPR